MEEGGVVVNIYFTASAVPVGMRPLRLAAGAEEKNKDLV